MHGSNLLCWYIEFDQRIELPEHNAPRPSPHELLNQDMADLFAIERWASQLDYHVLAYSGGATRVDQEPASRIMARLHRMTRHLDNVKIWTAGYTDWPRHIIERGGHMDFRLFDQNDYPAILTKL